MSPKLLVIGLDGATWDLIKPWADEGKLPTFKKLMEKGSWGYLESTIPPWTIPAWESMCTGKNPKKLGFATFMVKDGYKFIPHIFKHTRQKMVWEYLSSLNYKVVIANLPNVYAAQKINGCVIAGWLCLDKSRITYPRDLIDELHKHCKGYEIDIFDVDFEKGQITRGPKDNEYLKRCEKLLEKHFLAFKYLLKKCEWDFGFIVFVTPDRVQHKFWNSEILFKHYKIIDEKLNDIINTIDKEAIIFLVSDHGFGEVKYTLNINNFLINEGYLKLKDKKTYKKNIITKLIAYLRNGKLYPLARTLINLLPHTVAKQLKEKIVSTSFEKINIDWSNTKAFAYGVFGDIYINVKERDPLGIVDPNKYNKIRGEIIKKIKNIKYGGEALDILVLKKEEVYPNATLQDNLPDLIIVPTDDGIHAINPNIELNEVITKSKDAGGNHRLTGIFLAYGKGIKKRYYTENLKIYDITPTILHIFGLPIPKDMDGKVLVEIFEPDSEFAKREPKYVDPSYYDRISERQKIRAKLGKIKTMKKL